MKPARTPTTSHWPSDSNRKSNFPRSWTRPVTCIHSGLPSRRMASAVWRRCSICDKLVCGSRTKLESHYSSCSSAINVAGAHIWVGLVHESVQHLHRLPDPHPGTPPALEVHSSLDVERHSLLFCRGLPRVNSAPQSIRHGILPCCSL